MYETEEDILAVCGHVYPEVIKRTYKEPEFLAKDGSPRRWETVQLYYQVIERKDTSERQIEIHTTDIFYRPYQTTDQPWQYAYSYKNKQTSKKYRCIGGPLDGQVVTNGDQYVNYNCGVYNHNNRFPTGMLIHESLLK